MKQITIAKKLVKEYEGITSLIPCINSGGCGMFAQYLYSFLTKLGVSVKLVVYTTDLKSFEYRISNSIIDRDIDFNHVMLEVDGLLIDCHGIQDRLKKSYWDRYHRTDILTIEDLNKLNNIGGWNPSFDRRNLSLMLEILENAYKKVEKKVKKIW